MPDDWTFQRQVEGKICGTCASWLRTTADPNYMPVGRCLDRRSRAGSCLDEHTCVFWYRCEPHIESALAAHNAGKGE